LYLLMSGEVAIYKKPQALYPTETGELVNVSIPDMRHPKECKTDNLGL